jgi:hypothetical protein
MESALEQNPLSQSSIGQQVSLSPGLSCGNRELHARFARKSELGCWKSHLGLEDLPENSKRQNFGIKNENLWFDPRLLSGRPEI